jgi:hypothetical protein
MAGQALNVAFSYSGDFASLDTPVHQVLGHDYRHTLVRVVLGMQLASEWTRLNVPATPLTQLPE